MVLIGLSMVKIDIFTIASGKVIPKNRPVNLGVSQGGIIEKLFVKVGDNVAKKDLIAKIDDSALLVNIKNLRTEIKQIENILLIQESLISGKSLLPPMKPSLLYALKQQHLNYINDLKKLIAYHQEEKKIIEDLVKKKTLPNMKSIEVNQKLIKEKKEINRSTKEFWEKLIYDYEQKKLLITKLQSLQSSELLKLEKTKILAPRSGIISKINFEPGEFISSGNSIAQLVPENENIQVELLVKPKDIGGVKLGQKVTLKVDTFNYKIFGAYNSKVVFISPKATRETENGNYFVVKCSVENNYMVKDNKKFYLKNGMTVIGSIVRGNVSALIYLIGPAIKSFHNIGVI